MSSSNTEHSTSYFLIISACLLLLLSFGYRSSFGLFVQPITQAHGWGRETISMALAIQNLFWGIIAVFAGGLADRYGNFRVIAAGALFYAGGMFLISEAESQWSLYCSAGIIVGAGIAGTSFGIILPALARAAGESRRQMALGMGTAAGSLGQFALVPTTQQLMDNFGWMTTLNILAASALCMILLAIPLSPYSGDQDTSVRQNQNIGEALQEALTQPSFILLVCGFFVCGFHVTFITTHMPAFLIDNGFTPQLGAWSIAIIGLCNVAGSFLSGIVSSRISKRFLLVIIYLARSITIAVFLLLPMTVFSVLIFSAVMGFLWLATVPPTSGLVAVMFGTRYMSLLYGIVFLGHQIGGFTGVWLGGWLYDHKGSYDIVWWLGVALGIIAAITHWPIKEQPVKSISQKFR